VVYGLLAAFKYKSSQVQTWQKPSGFLRAENPQRAFLQKGSKGVGPMS
jgi:hypothetical protein